MAQVESLNCMKDITIVHVGKRNFRVPTASLPSKYSSCKDIYVDKESDSSNIKAGSTKEEEITLELKIPRYLYGYIIGRGGSTVKQLREETKTKINLPYHKGPVTITGTKDKAEIAKKRIEDIIAPYNNNTGNEKSINDTKIEDKNKDNVEDYETIVLNIFWRLHRIIIGSRGSTIIQIQEETKTRITSLSYDNLIVISGTKDGVEMAKKRIENIIESYNKTENEKSNDTKIEDKMKDDVESFKESIKDIEVIILKIPGRLHGSIIGWGGSIVRQIKDETKTGINALSDDNLVVISGVKDGVEMAKKRIEDIIESQNKPESEKSNDTKIEDKKKDDVESINESIKDNEEITFKFNVPRRSLGLIIGRGGSTVRKIKDETNTKITALSDESLVIISGSKDGVEMAKKQIEDIIESYNNAGNEKSFNNNTGIEDNKNENIGLIRESIREKKEVNERYVTESLDIPQPLHGLIIGRGGSIIKQINYETRTRITLLPDDNLATISGTKGGIERAKKRIKEIIESDSIFKLPPTHFISLPLTDPHIQRKVEDFKSNKTRYRRSSEIT
ncbi:far upstream element-binding protein 3 isoform X1 [Rhizophagus clarus]|uniref:Far upstream element-binding protein 3 isoform X1 n=1 Tax=Rhizophagus clarus TaxID=94130 RepID=A0A8H3LID7_9GLOM|nr:far upstream element-binding protein 3 isoform X1 [Rhizophagus clarus]